MYNSQVKKLFNLESDAISRKKRIKFNQGAEIHGRV